jgi:hypothetical protein
MTARKLQAFSIAELVERFVQLGIAQDEADLDGDIARYNRLYKAIDLVREELKMRPDDQRVALLSLYGHANMQVRLIAAKSTLAVAPAAARRQLQLIADSKHYPQAGSAGVSLLNLDRGIFKPT